MNRPYVGRHRFAGPANRLAGLFTDDAKRILVGLVVAAALIVSGGIVWSTYELGRVPELRGSSGTDSPISEPEYPTGS